ITEPKFTPVPIDCFVCVFPPKKNEKRKIIENSMDLLCIYIFTKKTNGKTIYRRIMWLK
ncbi:unnamed protein product, partial [Diamesa tonsa]